MKERTTSLYHDPVTILAILAILFCSVMAYYSILTNVQPQDDEGQLIMTVRSFISGRSVYSNGASIYGPYYYLYEYLAHKLMGVPISIESARYVSLVFWMTASLLALLVVYRATGSPIISLISLFFVFRALAFIPDFPAHPQELCITLLVAFALAGFVRDRFVRMATLGALAGALTATKINAGAFAVLALAVVLAYTVRTKWPRSVVFLSFGVAAIPMILMWGHRSDHWAEKYCFILILSITAVIITVSRMELARELEIRHLFVAGTAFVTVIAVGSFFSILHGSSIQELLTSTILRPGSAFSHGWFFMAHIKLEAMPFALGGLALAYYIANRREHDYLVALLKLGLACGIVFLANKGLIWFDSTRFDAAWPEWARENGYHLALFFSAPFLWLVAVPNRGSNISSEGRFGRALLAVIAVIQVLYAYPVAAIAHIRIASVLMFVVAGVCLADSLQYLSLTRPLWRNPLIVRGITTAVAVMLVGLSFAMAHEARQRYQSMEPLKIAGMERIRVPQDRAYAMRELVRRVLAHGCTRLFTVPSMFSLNLWTQTQPITVAAGNWVNAASDTMQEQLVQFVSREPQSCIVISRRLIEYWMPDFLEDVSSKPVIRFISQNYTPEFIAFVKPDLDYQLMIPNELASVR